MLWMMNRNVCLITYPITVGAKAMKVVAPWGGFLRCPAQLLSTPNREYLLSANYVPSIRHRSKFKKKNQYPYL